VQARLIALALAAAGLAGCASDPAATPPGPAYEREMKEGRPGLFGNLTWTVDHSGNREAATSEAEDYKRWKESNPTSADRREFEEWRAWQEWKKQNPK
jgi:hypothetical protein